MKKPEIGSKVVYIKTTKTHSVRGPDMDIGTICTITQYLVSGNGVGVNFNKGKISALFWDEFRELTLLEKELYED